MYRVFPALHQQTVDTQVCGNMFAAENQKLGAMIFAEALAVCVQHLALYAFHEAGGSSLMSFVLVLLMFDENDIN